jgi:RNA polymerase sigma factor (sigma-70 family)
MPLLLPTGAADGVLQCLRRVAGPGDSDQRLLERFAATRDEAAFAALVERHGRLVWGVCRRVLGEASAAEDAFQAAFVLLARRPDAVRLRASVGSFLYGAAYRLALKARTAAARRRAHERRAVELRPTPTPADPAWRELMAVLDEELRRLPDVYRAPLVACFLQGRTRDEAARELGWSVGTLRRRLDRGRELLRLRLTRRGATLAAGLCATALAPEAMAVVPPALATAAARSAAGGPVVPAVAALLPAAGPVRLKVLGGLAVLLGALAAGTGFLGSPHAGPAPAAEPPAASPAETVASEPLPEGAIARLGTLRFRQGEDVLRLAYAPDGKTILSQGQRAVCLWDTATGERRGELRAPPAENGSFATPVVAAATVGSDGRTAVTVLTNRNPMRELVQVWDLESRTVRRQFEFRTEPQDTVRGAEKYAFSADGIRLAVRESDNSVRLVDVEAGRTAHRLSGDWQAHAVAFTPDGRSLVVGDATHTLRVFDAATGKEQRSFGGGGQPVALLAFTPDGKRLASVGMTIKKDGQVTFFNSSSQVRLWDFARGTEERVVEANLFGVAALTFSPDGSKFVTGGWGRVPAVRVWDTATGQLVRDFGELGNAVRTVAVSPDGRSLAAAGFLGIIRQWDLATGAERPKLDGNAAAISWVLFDPDGRGLRCGGDFAPPRRWEVRTGRPLPTTAGSVGVVHTMSGAVGTLAASADGRWLAVAEDWRTDTLGRLLPTEVRVIERATGQVRHRLTLPFGRLTLSPDGRFLVCQGILEKATQVWDVVAGRQVFPILGTGKVGGVDCLGFTPDGRMLTKDGDGVVRTWDAATGRDLAAWDLIAAGVLRRDSADQYELAAGPVLSPDGRTLACTIGFRRGDSYSFDGRGDVLLLDLAAKRTLRRIAGLGRPTGRLAFSPDGKFLAAGALYDPVARVYEVATGREVRQLTGHRGAVVSVAFSPDGSLLVTGSHDATALVWEMRPRATGAARPTADLWADLAGDDAAAAYRAAAQVSAQADGVALLRQHLRPVSPLDAAGVTKAIADLDSDTPAVRQEASRRLAAAGRRVEPALRRALDRGPSLEARQRMQRLLDGFAGDLSPDELRERRAVTALEWAGTPDARKLLAELAGGDPDAALTQDARAALGRLTKRNTH